MIIEFINRRFSKDCNWLNGNCFWFALILKERFPFLKIYYLPIDGHFVVGDGNKYYDWSGEIDLEEKPYELNEIKETDKLWYEKLMRDCFA